MHPTQPTSIYIYNFSVERLPSWSRLRVPLWWRVQSPQPWPGKSRSNWHTLCSLVSSPGAQCSGASRGDKAKSNYQIIKATLLGMTGLQMGVNSYIYILYRYNHRSGMKTLGLHAILTAYSNQLTRSWQYTSALQISAMQTAASFSVYCDKLINWKISLYSYRYYYIGEGNWYIDN